MLKQRGTLVRNGFILEFNLLDLQNGLCQSVKAQSFDLLSVFNSYFFCPVYFLHICLSLHILFCLSQLDLGLLFL